MQDIDTAETKKTQWSDQLIIAERWETRDATQHQAVHDHEPVPMKHYRMIPLMVRWGGTIAWIMAAACTVLGGYLSLRTGEGGYAVGGVVCALAAYAIILTASEIIDVISETLLPR